MSTKPKTITTTLRIPEDMHGRAAIASDELHIPLNSFVLQAISEKLKRGDWLDQRETDDGK
jgi:predicted HicB family RNase H-like nuclease